MHLPSLFATVALCVVQDIDLDDIGGLLEEVDMSVLFRAPSVESPDEFVDVVDLRGLSHGLHDMAATVQDPLDMDSVDVSALLDLGGVAPPEAVVVQDPVAELSHEDRLKQFCNDYSINWVGYQLALPSDALGIYTR